MSRTAKCIALLVLTLPLGGCAAGIAASAAGMAVRGSQGEPQTNRHLQPQAREACAAHAAQFGTVHVVDVEQRAVNRIVVWGTVAEQAQRRSFECAFTDRIISFRLRAIRRQG